MRVYVSSCTCKMASSVTKAWTGEHRDHDGQSPWRLLAEVSHCFKRCSADISFPHSKYSNNIPINPWFSKIYLVYFSSKVVASNQSFLESSRIIFIGDQVDQNIPPPPPLLLPPLFFPFFEKCMKGKEKIHESSCIDRSFFFSLPGQL